MPQEDAAHNVAHIEAVCLDILHELALDIFRHSDGNGSVGPCCSHHVDSLAFLVYRVNTYLKLFHVSHKSTGRASVLGELFRFILWYPVW